MKIMDSKELMNDIGFKLQSSVGLSIVQVPVVYMFKSVLNGQNFPKVTNIKNYGNHFIS